MDEHGRVAAARSLHADRIGSADDQRPMPRQRVGQVTRPRTERRRNDDVPAGVSIDQELRARVQVALRMKQDRDELVARNRELDRLSGTDPLTGLRNRRGLERDLERLEVRLRGQTVGVLVIDIDRFKSINDNFGHPATTSAIRPATPCSKPSPSD